MKKIKNVIWLIALVAMTVTFTSFTLTKKPKGGDKIEIKAGKLKINGKSFSHPWSLSSFEGALGKSDRMEPGGNDIYTYDQKGIILYYNGGKVSDFNVYYGNDPNESYSFVPKSYSSAALIIEGKEIKSNTPLSKLQKLLPQYEIKKSLIDAYRGEYKKLYVYFMYDDSKSNILWISCGKKDE